jgi:hypothetical protein
VPTCSASVNLKRGSDDTALRNRENRLRGVKETVMDWMRSRYLQGVR